jgi:hypothetical protein
MNNISFTKKRINSEADSRSNQFLAEEYFGKTDWIF